MKSTTARSFKAQGHHRPDARELARQRYTTAQRAFAAAVRSGIEDHRFDYAQAALDRAIIHMCRCERRAVADRVNEMLRGLGAGVINPL